MYRVAFPPPLGGIESCCWGRISSGEERKERRTKGKRRGKKGRVKKGKITGEEGKGNDGKGN